MAVIGYLTTSEKLLHVDDLTPVDFDVIVGVASWEDRCRTIIGWRGVRAHRGLLFRFDSDLMKDEPKARNLRLLQRKYSEVCTDFESVVLPPSTNMLEALDVVGFKIIDAYASGEKRLRICLDVSSMPRSMISFILLYCFKNQLADSIQIFFGVSDHTESVQLIRGTASAIRNPLVEGKWELNAIPYAEGALTASRTDHMVLSVGFDTYQILDVIERLEPYSAMFLLPTRGDGSEIDHIAANQKNLLQERFRAEFASGRYQLMSIPPYSLGWVSEVERALSRRLSEGGAVMLYPFGPKVHSVGLTLLALRFEEAALIGRTPTFYYHRQVNGTNCVSMIDLRDISSPTAQLNGVEDRSFDSFEYS